MGSKNILLILLAVVIIGGAFVFSAYRGNTTASTAGLNANFNPAVSVATTTSTLEPISYDDNWQKTLVSAAASSSWSTSGISGAVSSAPNAPLTTTDILGRAIFGEYVAAKQNGEDTSATNTQISIAGQVMSDGTFIAVPKVYDKSSFTIINDNSKAALFAYGNQLGVIFKSNKSSQSRNEITIVQDAINKGDSSSLKELNPIITSYNSLLKQLLAMKVPSAVADLHKNLINALSELVFADQGFTKIYADNVVALEAVAMYQNSVEHLGLAVASIAQYFKIIDVTFSPSDAGALFTIKTQ